MAPYPVKGSLPWDETLKAYIDDQDEAAVTPERVAATLSSPEVDEVLSAKYDPLADHIDIPPSTLMVKSGTPNLAYVSGLGAGMMFDGVQANPDDTTMFAVPVPPTWNAVTLVLYWTAAVASGSCRWKTYVSSFTAGNLWPIGASLITDAALAVNGKQVRTVTNTAVAVTPGSWVTVEIDRLSSSSVDTINDADVSLQMVQLVKAG